MHVIERRLVRRTRWLAIAGILLLIGCNRGPQPVVVSGKVIYRGEPVREGEIVFADEKSGGPAAVGKIDNGRYRVETLPGEKRIRVTATRETGKIIEGAMGAKYPERVDLIPAQYNTDSTLVRTVKPNEKAVVDLSLE